MAGPDRIEWRGGVPTHALRLVGSCLSFGALAVGAAWLLFGDEPETLTDGEVNPLAAVPQWTLATVAAIVGVALVGVLRRPAVGATHYALRVRPGALRTLLLPWTGVAEVVTVPVGGEEYLLIRLREGAGTVGDRPGWSDQGVLRTARRHYRRASDYQLAVRLRDFAGPPQGKLRALAAYAPESVYIADRLSSN
jgi:hypothetical protein